MNASPFLFPDLAPEPSFPCVSLWQPWASLWAAGRKKNETRDWMTSHRGLILIHAAKRVETDIDPQLVEIVVDQFGKDWATRLPRGAVIGNCKLVDMRSTNHLGVDAQEYAQGNYGPDRFAWRGIEHRTFERPVPFRGLQTIFRVPQRLVPEVVPV